MSKSLDNISDLENHSNREIYIIATKFIATFLIIFIGLEILLFTRLLSKHFFEIGGNISLLNLIYLSFFIFFFLKTPSILNRVEPKLKEIWIATFSVTSYIGIHAIIKLFQKYLYPEIEIIDLQVVKGFLFSFTVGIFIAQIRILKLRKKKTLSTIFLLVLFLLAYAFIINK